MTEFRLKIVMDTLLRHLAAALLGVGLVAVSLATFAQTLHVSAIPDEAPTELQRKFKPLGEYLARETGLDVQFTPVSDYAAVVKGLVTKKIDLQGDLDASKVAAR